MFLLQILLLLITAVSHAGYGIMIFLLHCSAVATWIILNPMTIAFNSTKYYC